MKTERTTLSQRIRHEDQIPWISPLCFPCLKPKRCACLLIHKHTTTLTVPFLTTGTATGCLRGLPANPSQGAAAPGTHCTAPSWSVRKPQPDSFTSHTILLVTSPSVEGISSLRIQTEGFSPHVLKHLLKKVNHNSDADPDTASPTVRTRFPGSLY